MRPRPDPSSPSARWARRRARLRRLKFLTYIGCLALSVIGMAWGHPGLMLAGLFAVAALWWTGPAR